MANVIARLSESVRMSFQNVKADIDEVKRSVTDWLLYLDSNHRELVLRVAQLEKEVRELKKKQIVEIYN